MKRKNCLFLSCVLAGSLLAGCGSGTDVMQNGAQESSYSETQNDASESTSDVAQNETSESADSVEQNNASENTGESAARGKKIESQSFNVDLEPFGNVTFASYEPDTSKNALADVVFCIEQDEKLILQLPGANAENVNTELFHQVEAVSFTDYTNDGIEDIIVIVSYYYNEGEQGDEGETTHSTIRYYEGSANGSFNYEVELSEEATSAIAEISIETAKGFVNF